MRDRVVSYGISIADAESCKNHVKKEASLLAQLGRSSIDRNVVRGVYMKHDKAKEVQQEKPFNKIFKWFSLLSIFHLSILHLYIIRQPQNSLVLKPTDGKLENHGWES